MVEIMFKTVLVLLKFQQFESFGTDHICQIHQGCLIPQWSVGVATSQLSH